MADDDGDAFEAKLKANAEFEANRLAFIEHMNERVAEIRMELKAFIARYHEADAVEVTKALLELGFEREIDLVGQSETQRFAVKIIDKVAERLKGSLH